MLLLGLLGLVSGCGIINLSQIETSLLAAAATPTPFPTPRPLYTPGMQVEVQTVGGEVLYLRDMPSTDAAILRYLYDRNIVVIVEGPIEADGFRWWRVRTEDGEEGWAAQAVDDVTTLVPVRED